MQQNHKPQHNNPNQNLESKLTQHLPDDRPVLRVTTRPNDANLAGDIFGGWLMSHMDIAGAIVAKNRAKGAVVTRAVKQLQFIEPLYVYDLVNFYGAVAAVGKTSITVELQVFAQRSWEYEKIVKISDATLVYVAVSKPGEKRLVPPI